MKSDVHREAIKKPSLLSDIIYEHDHLIVKKYFVWSNAE